MACTNHPAIIEGIQPCARCSLPFCPNCLVVFQGQRLCGPCKNERIRALQSGRPEGELQLATVGRRFGAIWIDGLILVLPIWLLVFGLIASGAMGAESTMLSVLNLLFYVAPIFYEGLFLANGGQTPGKKYLGLKVVNPDGSDISTGQAWGRAVSKTLINICAGIGYLPAFFTKERTCVHDSLAKTRVIRL